MRSFGASFADFLFDCNDALPEGPVAHGIVNSATTATLEEALLCRDDDLFGALEAAFPEVEELVAEQITPHQTQSSDVVSPGMVICTGGAHRRPG